MDIYGYVKGFGINGIDAGIYRSIERAVSRQLLAGQEVMKVPRDRISDKIPFADIREPGT